MTQPNLATRLLMIDFDATILPWGPLMEPRTPFAGVKEAINNLANDGYRIGIFTSRLSPTWIRHEGTSEQDQRDYVTNILQSHGIHFDFITAEKIPAEAYFDDKAVFVYPGSLAAVLRWWRDYKQHG
jgi:hypothetical protein